MRIILLALLALVALPGFAQDAASDANKRNVQKVLEQDYDAADFDPNVVGAGRLKKLAKRAKKIGDAYSVVDYLTVYMEKKPDDMNRAWMLAEALRETRDYKSAEDWYNKINADPSALKKHPKAKFYLATMQKQNGYYEGAAELLGDFRKSYTKGKDVREMKKLAKSEATGASTATRLIEAGTDSNNVIIIRLSNDINQETIENAPSIIDRNQIVYGTIFADVEEYYAVQGTDRPDRKLYIAERVGPNKWQRIDELPGPFNQEGYNVPEGTYSPDGLSFYFTRCPKVITKKNKCAIYVAKFRDGRWLDPERLPAPVNYDKFNSRHPAVGLAPDPRTKRNVEVLFWSSDYDEKSKGGYDIFYSKFDTKKNIFRKAKNAGSKVNGVGDEITPFFNVDEGLYFSSNSHPNLGGFDIYLSEGTPQAKFNRAVQMPYPINSPADDIGYVVDAAGDIGFFASNREGSNSSISPTACDDIYQFVYTDFIKVGLKGFVFEDDKETRNKIFPNSSNYLENVTVSLLGIDNEDGGNGDTIILQEAYPEGGQEFYFNLKQGRDYILKASREFYDDKFYPVSTKDITFSDTISVDMGLYKTPPKVIKLPKIFFETNRFAVDKVQQEELLANIIPILEENPSLRLQILGFADDVGNSKYNEKLSLKRAQNVFKLLVGNGIDEDRFVVSSFGEERPALDPNSVEDQETARRMNRRVEFEIYENPAFIMAN